MDQQRNVTGQRRGRHARRLTALGAVLLAAAGSSGCLSARSAVPGAAVPVPESWQAGASAATQQPGSQDLARWWERLGDTTLTELITRALQASPDVRTAQSRLREARAQYGLARVDLFPSVNAALSGQGIRTDTDGQSATTQHLYNAAIDASWEPDIFGAASSAVRAAQASLEASAADLGATRVSLAAEVALDYVDLRSYQARLAIASDNLASQTETLALTRYRAVAGLATDLDVEQSRTTVEQTRAQIPALETGVAEARHRLAVLLGQPPAALDELLGTAAPIPSVPGQVAVEIPADTLRQRPDVRAAERRLAAATATLDEARAARYPSLKLTGSFGVEGVALTGLTSGGTVVSSLLGSLTAPIFDRARIRRQIDVSTEAQEQALITYEQTILTSLQEVEDALVELANAGRTSSARDAAAGAARNAADLARDRYAAGLENYQVVLDTERTVLTAEEALAIARASHVSALVRLFKALGGGWEDAAAADVTQVMGGER